MTSEDPAQDLAQACADAMWAGDAASRGLGMTLDWVRSGTARLSMPVTAAMLNGFGTCHGGFIFALADSAFAFACNTDGPASVAIHCAVTFLRPARLGDTLAAEAAERHRAGRSGIYDVQVTADGEIVAEFRGHSRTTGGRVLEVR